MTSIPEPDNGAAGCGYLIVLALIGWAVVAMLPYILAGVAACFAVWILVRFHREAWMVVRWTGELLVWTVVAIFVATRWAVFHACAWIARHCRIPTLSAPPVQSSSPHDSQPTANITSSPPSGWKLKNRSDPP